MEIGTRPVEAAPEEERINAEVRKTDLGFDLPRRRRRRGIQSIVVGGGGASSEIGTRPVEAAPEEERINSEVVRVPTVPEINGWRETTAAIVAAGRAAHHKKLEERRLAEKGLQEGGQHVEHDWFAVEASQFRDTWNRRYSKYCGCFEDTTNIKNKRFTYKKPHDHASPQTTLQVFSLKIAKLRVPLQWPLQVFGIVAIRDCVDHNRNIIFDRPRDNCQIVTQEDPYLKLTGPTRAVVVLDPATFEVDLKVKGTTESEDQWLSFLAVTYRHFSEFDSHLLERDYASKHSELQFQLGSIIRSVEATIEVRITSGSWPHGLRAQFTAGTASIPGAEVILLDSGDHEVPVAKTGGCVKLSRCVASVEVSGELWVHVKAFLGDKIVVDRVKPFKPQIAGVSNGSVRVDFNREISKAKKAGKGEISKAKTAGKGDGPLGVHFLGCCTFGFNISWSVISFLEV